MEQQLEVRGRPHGGWAVAFVTGMRQRQVPHGAGRSDWRGKHAVKLVAAGSSFNGVDDAEVEKPRVMGWVQELLYGLTVLVQRGLSSLSLPVCSCMHPCTVCVWGGGTFRGREA